MIFPSTTTLQVLNTARQALTDLGSLQQQVDPTERRWRGLVDTMLPDLREVAVFRGAELCMEMVACVKRFANAPATLPTRDLLHHTFLLHAPHAQPPPANPPVSAPQVVITPQPPAIQPPQQVAPLQVPAR